MSPTLTGVGERSKWQELNDVGFTAASGQGKFPGSVRARDLLLLKASVGTARRGSGAFCGTPRGVRGTYGKGDRLRLGDTSSRLVADICNRHSDLFSSNSAAPRKLDRVVELRSADDRSKSFPVAREFFPSAQLCSLVQLRWGTIWLRF
jgi:hypothetical protein